MGRGGRRRAIGHHSGTMPTRTLWGSPLTRFFAQGPLRKPWGVEMAEPDSSGRESPELTRHLVESKIALFGQHDKFAVRSPFRGKARHIERGISTSPDNRLPSKGFPAPWCPMQATKGVRGRGGSVEENPPTLVALV